MEFAWEEMEMLECAEYLYEVMMLGRTRVNCVGVTSNFCFWFASAKNVFCAIRVALHAPNNLVVWVRLRSCDDRVRFRCQPKL